MTTCRLDFCSRPMRYSKSGLCLSHHRYLLKGQPLVPLKAKKHTWEDANCLFQSCPEVVVAKGYCSYHYELVRNGKPLREKPQRIPRGFRNPDGLKWCGDHKGWEIPDNFHKDSNASDGLTRICKKCSRLRYNTPKSRDAARAHRLRRKYGLTPAKYEDLWRRQREKCAGCGTTSTGKRGWHIDHDHSCCPGSISCSRCVRGILCQGCNLALGAVNDNPNTLRNLARYIERTT